MQRSPQSLRRVLDEEQSGIFRQTQELVHVTEPPVEMDRHDRPRAWCDGGGRLVDVHEVVITDVDQHRGGAGVVNRCRRGHERVGDGDHLVTGPDAGRPKREMERVGAVARAHRKAGADERGKVRLEVPELLPQHQVAA